MKSWTKASLGEICGVNIGRTPARNRSAFWGDGHAWLSIADMNQGRDLRTTKETITDLAIRECNCRQAEVGTVLLSFKLSIGKVGIAQIPLFTNEAIAALPIQDRTRLCSEYLYWALQSVDLTLGLDRAAMGLTLNKAKLLNIEIPLPPLAEQRRIAEVLDRAEALRAKRRAALAQLDALTQSLFLDLFGDPMTNPKGWKTCLLEEVAKKITDGTHKTPAYKDSGIEFLSAKDLKEGGIAWGTEKFISEEEHRELVRRCNPELGDILLAKSGSLGNVAIIDRSHEFSLFESLCLIKHDRERIEGQFLTGLLRAPSMLAHLLGKNKGVAIKHLHLVDVRNLRIPLPPIPLQREFARRVTAVESLKAAQRASLAELDALFATLQHRAFHGEL